MLGLPPHACTEGLILIMFEIACARDADPFALGNTTFHLAV